jgi:diguanylate cyclase (GGDEF)-like protein/PAS domain S-box-containing protein
MRTQPGSWHGSERALPESRAGLQRLPIAEGALAALYLLSSVFAFRVTNSPDAFAPIWPANAIAAAALIRFESLRVAPALALVAIAAVLGNVIGAQEPLQLALPLALIDLLGVGLTVWVYRFLIRFPVPAISINQGAQMTAVMGFASPAVVALLGGILGHLVFGAPWLDATLRWWVSDALGACLFAPPIILYSGDAVRRLMSRRFAARNVATMAASLAFCYIGIRYVRFPFVVIGVPLLIAAFSLGGFGTAVLSLLSGVAVIALWRFGVLPKGLEATEHAISMSRLPLWALMSTLLPPIAVAIGTDERRLSARKLRLSEGRFRQSLARSPIGTVIVNLEGLWVETNAAVQSMLGYTAEEFRSLPFGALTHPDDREETLLRWDDLRSGRAPVYETEQRFRHKNGAWIWTRMVVSRVEVDAGEPPHYLFQMESLESRRTAERALAQERELLKTTLRAIGNGVIATDANRRITYLNAAARDMLGLSPTQLEMPFREAATLTDPASSQPAPDLLGRCLALGKVMRRPSACALHRPDGTISFVVVSASPLFADDGQVTGAVVVLQDVTEQYQHDKETSHQARHDTLTNLVNRIEYQRRAKRAFERARMLDECAAMIAIDLDRFKLVNDSGGHAAGDAVLRRVAAVLKSVVRQSDTVARVGGDEFAIVLENCTVQRTAAIAQQLLDALNPMQIQWEGTDYEIGASIGVAFITPETPDEAAWLAAADRACYSAKRAGRGQLRTAGDEFDTAGERGVA